MTLNIHASWHQPTWLRDGAKSGYIYSCPDFESVPEEPGVYVFGRQFGDSAIPLYIGRSENLRKRLSQHLDSVRLMNALRNAESGRRFFLPCTIQTKRGQNLSKVLKTLEGRTP